MNRNRLFVASCIALVTTSMFFSIRGDAADALSNDFQLTNEQLGFIFQPAFYGFTVSILIGGSLVDLFGMRRLLTISGLFYIFGILAIVLVPFPGGPVASIFGNPVTVTLWLAMLALGLAQGLVEGVINPLCSTLYPEDKTHRMNVLHAWWPGGLIVGGLLAYFISVAMGLGPSASPETATLGWRVKLMTIPVVALAYLLMIRGQVFPATERVAAGVSNRDMFRELLRPSFIALWVCMWLTSASELGPDQWVPSLITNLTGGMP
ncbi:MAG: MFS transporter, partial [Bryobacterales bacterium]|nr:MFS transporter [Bryobacterales bacterium]